MSSTKSFLLAFDYSKNELLICEDFGTDLKAATAAYSKVESEYMNSSHVNVLLVSSDSIETVKVTHSTYFKDGARNLIKDALGLMPA